MRLDSPGTAAWGMVLLCGSTDHSPSHFSFLLFLTFILASDGIVASSILLMHEENGKSGKIFLDQ